MPSYEQALRELDDFGDELLDDDQACTWCGGDGTQECTDPIQCTSRHDSWRHPDTGAVLLEEACSACRGTGLRKDQVLF